MANTALRKKAFLIVGIALVAISAAIMLVNNVSRDSSVQAHFKPLVTFTPMGNFTQKAGGGPQEYIEKHSVEVSSIDEARETLKYDFPVPSDSNGYKLTGIYVEDGRILYLKYGDAIYVVYHKLPEDFEPNIEDTLSKRPDLEPITIRGNNGIAGEVDKGLNSKRVGGELFWYEDGLDIAIYSLQGTRVGQLIKIAESMK